MLIGVNEANGNNLLVTARLTSDTEKQAPPPTRAVPGGGVGVWVGGLISADLDVLSRSAFNPRYLCQRTQQLHITDMETWLSRLRPPGAIKGRPFSSAEPDEVN